MYSVKHDGAYCKYCKLLAIGDRGALFQVSFCRWKNARSAFEAHMQGNAKDKTRGFCGYKLHSNALFMAAEMISQKEGDT